MIRYLWAFLIILLFAGCQEVLVNNLSEAQSQRLCSVLAEKGIEFERELDSSGNWRIYVEKKHFRPALLLLKHNYLLADRNDPGLVEPSAFSTSLERKVHLQRLREQEIQHVLENLPGVVQARLLLSPAGDTGLKRSKNLQCGSLIVFANPLLQATPKQLRQIVAGATGLSARCLRTVVSNLAPVSTENPRLIAKPKSQPSNSFQFTALPRSFLAVAGSLSSLIGILVMMRIRLQGSNVSRG